MIIKAIILMGTLGFVISLILVLGSILFFVKEDPELEKLKAVLPGINCGLCGFIGCAGAAEAVLKKKVSTTVCVAGGASVARQLAEILGLHSEFENSLVLQIGCRGDDKNAVRYYYKGWNDCRAEASLYGGSSECEIGCIGHGSCVRICPFGALSIGPDKYPIVNPEKCRHCGRCTKICPHGVIGLVSHTDQLLKLHLKNQCLAPCQQKCPAQINIPLFIRQMLKKDYVSALLTIKDRNPLVLSVSRICSHACENICRRNIADGGVAIGRLERFLGEWELNSHKHVPVTCSPDTGHRVAVVGGGPAGLSCAYFLRRLGHHPVILEKRSHLGGMLRYGIPEYRLPRRVVDWEIESILELGVEIETRADLGRDFTLTDLENRGFEAIFLGLGAWSIPQLCIRGEHADGVINSLDFLSQVGLAITTLKDQKVVVVGESNTAMDCARSCIRLGAFSVTVICPKEKKEMSARKRDVARAMEEGVNILFMTAPLQVRSDNHGEVYGIECHRLPSPECGRAEAFPGVSDSIHLIEAQLIIAAYERKPDLYYLCHKEKADYKFKSSKKWTLLADTDTLLAGAPNVFTAGDMYTGRASVIRAVADGRRAARSIHFFLSRGQILIPDNLQRKINTKSILKSVQVGEQIPRVEVPEVSAGIRKRSLNQDIVGAITEKQAAREIKRCLYCGTTCYNR